MPSSFKSCFCPATAAFETGNFHSDTGYLPILMHRTYHDHPEAQPLLDEGHPAETHSSAEQSDAERGHLGPDSGASRGSPRRQTWRATLNLISATTGTSTTAVPLVLLSLGLGPGLVAVALQASLGVLANAVLSYESNAAGKDTYQGPHDGQSRALGWVGHHWQYHPQWCRQGGGVACYLD